MTEFFHAIGNMLVNGFTWAALGYALSTLENYYNKRQTKKLLYLIAKKVGVEWDTPQEELRKMAVLSSKKLYTLSHRVTIPRRMFMEKLKSRKFWLTILAALIPVINTEFGINLDLGSVVLIVTAIMAGVAALAHVDAKKVLASVLKRSVTVTTGSNNIKWDNITYKDARTAVKVIHDGVNAIYADFSKNDGSQAYLDAVEAYSQLETILHAVKKPEPLPEVTERQETA